MRYHDSRPVLQQPLQRLLNQHLRVAVDIRRRLVQNQDARVRHNRARKAQQLPLTEAQVHASLREVSVVPIVHLHNDVMDAHRLRRLYHVLVARARMVVLDIVAHGAREQERLLQHHAHLPRKRAARYITDVIPVHQYRALLARHVIESRNQRHQRSLARARRSHDRYRLARTDMQRQVLQHIRHFDHAVHPAVPAVARFAFPVQTFDFRARGVAEAQVLQHYIALQLR